MALSEVTIEDYGDVRYEEGREDVWLITLHNAYTTVKDMKLAQRLIKCPDEVVETYNKYISTHTPDEIEKKFSVDTSVSAP